MTDNRRTQVPYAPYRIEACASGGRVRHPATGKAYELNRDAVRLLNCCDGYHNLAEIIQHLSTRTGLPRAQVESIAGQRLGEMTRDGLLWWRPVPVRHFRIPAPTVVYLDITARCNLRCAHCGVTAGEPLEAELSSAEWIDIIGQLGQAGVQSAAFSGGEPLLHPDLMVLLNHAKSAGLMVELSTNGTRITPELARQLRPVVDHVQVSLDGSKPEIHDPFRGRRGAFEGAVRGMAHLREAGVPFMVGCVVFRDNLDDIEAVAGLAHGLGASSLRLIHFVPFGRGRESPDLEPTPAQLRKLACDVRAMRSRSPIEISEVNFEFLFEPPPSQSEDALHGPIGCGGAWSSLTITAQGEVLPCSFFAGMPGDNLRTRPFVQIWQHSHLLNYWRSLRLSEIEGKCRQCQWLSVCRVGCPAANFAHGRMFQPHVHCFLTPQEAAGGSPLDGHRG